MQLGEVADVLPGREPRIETVHVGKDPETLAGSHRIAEDVDPIDAASAAVRLEQRRQHAQRRRLSGAIGTEQPGHDAVLGAEGDPFHRDHRTEGLAQPLDLDHGEGPAKLTKKGGRDCD